MRQLRVHPRSRGATPRVSRLALSGMGPSPLTRGNRSRCRQGTRRSGSIPAHAGQPTTAATPAQVDGVHPRSRGATDRVSPYWTVGMGPSPLTRGNLEAVGAQVVLEGSIPAHAGQPRPGRAAASIHRVHPRSRGATRLFMLIGPFGRGPSPLTRGNQRARAGDGGRGRSIPAHAGQPSPSCVKKAASRVHPRSRGATAIISGMSSIQMGPSPLTRGNLVDSLGQAVPLGSIPAHAGQPRSDRRCAARSRVHPRSRGATCRCEETTCPRLGPSPLTRGNL